MLVVLLMFNILRRKEIEQQWLKAFSELEARVEERTATLTTEIFERKRVEDEFRKLATTDPLTGAYNRRHVLSLSEREFARARRYHTTLSVLMLDADHFKAINDTWGHDVGDDVLKSLTMLCEAHLRTSDIFGRLGGEEFILTLPETDSAAAAGVAERVRLGVESNSIPINGENVHFTVSIGVTELADEDASFADILKRADQAVYTAKDKGRNRVETG
jgi:diguanylate cyclase (GGDEF)-like protein